MAKSNYQYGMSITVLNLDESSLPEDLQAYAEQLQSHLNGALMVTEKGANQMEGGGWLIVSHDVTKIGSQMVASFLLRRPRSK